MINLFYYFRKYLFISAFCLFSFCGFAQNIYNNKIATVRELNIYGNGTNINIGKIIINNAQDPQNLLVQSEQVIDHKNNEWVTAFCIGHDSKVPLYGLELKMLFDNQIDSVKVVGVSYSIGGTSLLSTDKMSFNFISSEVHCFYRYKGQFVVCLYSKKKIHTTIMGLDAAN